MAQKKKRTVETYESYSVRIIDWKVDYSLRLDKDGSISGGPFWEHCRLELQGKFLGPKKLEGRGVTITLLGSRSLDEEIAKPDSINYEPLGVGGLTVRGKDATYIGSLPHKSFAIVLTMLQAGKIKYVIFNGTTLRYGSASIKGLTLTGEFDPDDYSN
jgi:hypothetical protein